MGAEEDATARRERLKALRAAKELLSAPDAAPAAEQQNGKHGATEEQVDQPTVPGPVDATEDGLKESDGLEDNGEMPLKFRNYLPHDEQLRGGKVAPLSLPKFEDPIAADAAEPKQLENPFGNIAPKNPNWDLKRDVQKRTDKLEKRTQKALAEIALEQQKEKEALEEGSDVAAQE
ncbi:coiled-coil domain-containing protein 12-like [Lolium rigidum]|uniref:coiled-coil domain-containing protein 12-like n=1 Tax=Lolium rigidum TaxID=89674 RepID=UPI001F5C59EE|nr:coiled-coil domain-containing protein 12-like [Lolium rigidum]XP_051200870.1 uncharacterized protein LOC127314443 [Lolium perenne]